MKILKYNREKSLIYNNDTRSNIFLVTNIK